MGQIVVPEQRAEVTDDTHLTQLQIHPVGAVAVPKPDPHWSYNNRDRAPRDHFLYCLIEGMKKIESTTKMIINFQPLTKGPKKTLLPF